MRIFVLVVLITIVCATDPPNPTCFPKSWYTWVVTTIVQGSGSPVFNKGQLMAFDLDRQLTCRYDQQDLITVSPVRPADMCDHVALVHYSVNDTASYAGCSGMSPLATPLTQIEYPEEFVKKATFIGIDHIASKNCNHFLGTQLSIDAKNVQMDVWTGVDDGYPCQMSIFEIGSGQVTIWAFVGFTEIIPADAMQCSSPKLICKEADWICRPKDGLQSDDLGKQLQWVCDPTNLDCSPINPGGSFFEPNNVVAHSTWAYNTYYKARRGDQGTAACNFGGTAELVPPSDNKVLTENTRKRQSKSPMWSIFPPDVICPSS